jgi:hypothetical protein
MNADLVTFVTGVMVGAFIAGIAFGGAYGGFVLRVRDRREQ